MIVPAPAPDTPNSPGSHTPESAPLEPLSPASTEHERALARMILETAEGFSAARLGELAASELARVAARHKGRALTEQILIELVEAALSLPFGAAPIARHAELTQAVAHALYQDPVARARLEHLWHELQAGGPAGSQGHPESQPQGQPQSQPRDVDK